MALSCQPSVSNPQPSQKGFFSLTLSPIFLRKQRKMFIVFMILTALGCSLSSSWYKAAVREDGYDDPEVAAREILSEMSMYCEKAAPGTFVIDSGPSNLPRSRIRFHLKDGLPMAYYEYKGGLYLQRDGESQKMFDGLLSAFFIPPSRSSHDLLVELQIWKQDTSANCSNPIAMIQRYIDIGPVRMANRSEKVTVRKITQSKRA